METVKFELDAGNNGWRCSGCHLFIDCLGRPIIGKTAWKVTSTSIMWIENYPRFSFCPQCGRKVQERDG